jgi:hypothetical protein
MRARHSDIFEAYAKIAQEQGLISTAEDEEDESKEKSSKEDKDFTLSEIFYGVQNKTVKELHDEAHPKTIVMAPSYDKLNGVVENLYQRSNIMSMIALKHPAILQTNSRYIKAHQDLINETVKLGFYLDNQNQEQLSVLADSCSSSLTKEAVAFLGIPVLYWVLGLVGLSSGAALAHNVPGSQGLKNDLSRLIKELNDAIEDYNSLSGILSPFIKNVQLAHSKLSQLDAMLDVISAKIVEVKSVVDKKQHALAVNSVAKDIISSGKDKEVEKLSDEMLAILGNILDTSGAVKDALSKAPQKYDGPASTIGRWLTKTFRVVIQSDVEDAIDMVDIVVAASSEYMKNIAEKLADLESLKTVISPNLKEDIKKIEKSPAKESEKSDFSKWKPPAI